MKFASCWLLSSSNTLYVTLYERVLFYFNEITRFLKVDAQILTLRQYGSCSSNKSIIQYHGKLIFTFPAWNETQFTRMGSYD